MSTQSRVRNSIISGIFFGISQIMTIVRLAFRAKHKRLWYDDAWAFGAFLFSVLLMFSMYDRLVQGRTLHHKVVAYWIGSFSFQNTLWGARMSVICAILRLIPRQDVLRKWTQLVAALFVGMWLGIIIQKAVVCSSDLSWYNQATPHCPLGFGVMVNELVTDICADLALAIVPILLYRNVSLPAQQRTMLFIIFASSLLISVVSGVHAYYLVGPPGIYEGFTAEVEASVALIVANIGVFVSFVYRYFRREIDTDPYTFEYSIRTDGRVRIRRKPGSNQKATEVVFARPHTSTMEVSATSTKILDNSGGESYELDGNLSTKKDQMPDSLSGLEVKS
ncbi:hypothetical protein DL96DRAFT_1613696 [Flagelloscypha sp. PMI_526]|nr:hypothetical protein DL96DRAFT_1613696 [Flagelloscypha sp. PMI_526]